MDRLNDIDDIISKKLSGDLAGEEQAALESWLAASPENHQEYEYLSKIWKEKSRAPKLINSGERAENIWQQAKHDKTPAGGGNYQSRPYLRIAAMITVVLGVSFMIYRLWESGQDQKVIRTANEIVRSTSPLGSKTRVALPDGSIAWLNSDSYIEFPEIFPDGSRQVDLVGEAYFEVRKDSLRPFTVRSLGANTTALGTSFNISAFPENETVEVHLITGRVLVNNVELTPGEGAIYNRTNEYIKVSQIEPDNVLGWKDGVLLFDGDNFSTFLKKIERWYGLEVTVTGKPETKWTVKGRFEKEYLTNVLNAVRFNKSFTYTLEGKKLQINFN
ncbi:MAG: FecR domain-containing protein [Cyclobacteriaceae bacterium]